ncbi:hypothetical protein MCAMS1_02215 [biofilm metagenome]
MSQVNCSYSFSFSDCNKRSLIILAGIFLFFLNFYGCSSSTLFSSNASEKSLINTHTYSTFGLHDITTFDVSVNDEAIHLLIGGKVSATDKKVGIRYLQSKDGGNTWSNPIIVANPESVINNRGNDIQLAAKGEHLLAMWQEKGELPGMGPLASAYSLDNGKTWIDGKNPAINDAGDQSHADVIADKDGHFHAVWLEDPDENGYQSLRYANSNDHGQSWSKAITIEDSTCSCCWNTLALSPNHDLNIFYRDMKPRDMALMRSSDAGKTWQRISTVGAFGWQFDGCPHVGGALAYDDAEPNRLYSLSWTGLEGKSGLYHLASSDNGKTWSTPFKLGKQAVHGDIAVFQGNIVAIWDEIETDGSIFYATSRDDGNTWSPAKKLTGTNITATHPRLVSTANGMLAVWTEKSGLNPSRIAWVQINP